MADGGLRQAIAPVEPDADPTDVAIAAVRAALIDVLELAKDEIAEQRRQMAEARDTGKPWRGGPGLVKLTTTLRACAEGLQQARPRPSRKGRVPE